MKFLISVILFAASLLLIATAQEKFSFTGYKLIRLYPKNDEQVKFINELEHIDNDVDIWGTVLVGDVKSIDIMLPPSIIDKYSKVFSQLNIEFEIVHDNIQELIDQESRSMEAKVEQNERYSIIYKYARYVEIMSYLEQIAADNSDIASTQNIGTTFQGRILKIIKLRRGNPTKSIWIDCGIHAREWVSPSSCVFMIARLIQELRNNDPEVVALFEKYDFHILPLHNPDGYEHSHTSFRLWRKNRKNYSNSLCYGTDLNRNYPAYWLSGGSSTNECSDVYAGPSSASELESRAVMAHINGQLKRWDAFLSFHSYGNWWLTPYGHTTTEVPPDYNLIMAAADAGVQAIKAYNGSIFVAGPTANLLYIATGSSADWAYSRGIRYSYVIELRPGPNTPDYTYGFMLPVDRMPLVANEAYIGTKAFLNHISKL